jgi:hypothetical protein
MGYSLCDPKDPLIPLIATNCFKSATEPRQREHPWRRFRKGALDGSEFLNGGPHCDLIDFDICRLSAAR